MSEPMKFPTNVSVRTGMGIGGWLLILGILGLGPCNDCMKGCGPTIDGKAIIEKALLK